MEKFGELGAEEKLFKRICSSAIERTPETEMQIANNEFEFAQDQPRGPQ